MKIKTLEGSGIVKMGITCNDIVLLILSYWLAFSITHSFSLALYLPYMLKIQMLIGALTIFPTLYIVPPVFTKRFVYGDDILACSVYTVCLQTLFVIAAMGLIRHIALAVGEILLGSVIFFILMYTERKAIHKYLKRCRSNGRNLRYVVLVGHPWYLSDIYHTLADHSLGFKVLGIFTKQDIPENMALQKLCDRRSVMKFLRLHPEVTDLYIVPDTDYATETEEIFRYCEDHLIRFYALPVFLEFLTKRMVLSHLNNTMLLSVRNEPLQDPVNRGVKRLFDIVVSGLFLLTAFPIISLIVGIIIKIQSPGPILFKQKRNGLDGKEFYCLKFRSMHVNKDADLIQATKDDPRKFKFGNLMRKTNIDELPQFINVFIGNMSLVGPRPHMLLHTQEYSHLIHRYMVRLLVKPGITGWAQVQGFRGETKTLDQMEARVKADIWYVENWTFSLDLR
ncbi:MAG: exopolysaccharide biosynthesis polyprenyl glycosylphosphotransferase, partial [Paraprevotella sp.]|nr:exopolysaccharide biosynthesis polyprenyl glycosylphosphotransferase [Paraprevotella sp.]